MTTVGRKPLRRATADRYVREITERVKEVNADDRFPYRIDRAVVFGSYVNEPSKDPIGDLDVALELVCKWEGEEQARRYDLARQRCPPSASEFLWLIWPYEEVLRYVRNRRGQISIHSISHDAEAVFSKDWLELDIRG